MATFISSGTLAIAQENVLLILLIQLVIIIGLSRALGLAFKTIYQPLVIGEIVAGILLGPSFLGRFAPGLSAQLFPTVSAPYLNILAQIGLVFFMFLVGLELNPSMMRGRQHVAVLVSHASIVVPFALGALLAWQLYGSYSDPSIPLQGFVLFMGAAMSVTAFPVLARILNEHGLQHTYIGSIAITCAAVDDITAWCILALVISVVRSGSVVSSLPIILLALAYLGIMLWLVRPVLTRLIHALERQSAQIRTYLLMPIIVIGLLISAAITEVIGIHTIFGAFLFGAILPKHRSFVALLTEKLEDVVVVVLLPLFFAYTGLRTEFSLLNTPALWLTCSVVILIATLGKFGGSTITARLSGMSWREASALGVLMNTRGLMELIILNIGLDLGVLSPTLFTMMVIMALVTTFLTTPLLERIYPRASLMLTTSAYDEASFASKTR